MIRKNRKGSGTGSAAAVHGNGFRKLLLIVASILMCCVLALGVVMLSSCRKGDDAYVNPYKTTTRVPYYAEYLGTVKRNIPTETSNGGLPDYPTYGRTLGSVLGDANAEARTALIRESNLLTTKQTWNGGGPYEKMDENGYLYLKDGTPVDVNGNAVEKGSAEHYKLYKHSASVGMYEGDVSDSEPAIVKRLTFAPRAYSSYYEVTGLYAPAGELIKIELSEEAMNATGGISVHIGQALYNGKANNIWLAKNQMQRMPVILNTLDVDKQTATFNEETKTYTAYVGSFLGGPVYVRDERVNYSVTISGGVRYSHFILGYTTPEEFAENAKSTAPYFDLEVWDNGVLHSGPVKYAKAFSYDELYKAAVYWDKVSLVSSKRSTQGVVFLYDPFVAAGAAVAFPGQRSVNCPTGWMGSSLNYKALVTSGSWGNMHEYNHNFQGYGLGNGGEVTNNALNLVEYSLFTKISSARKLGNYGAEGLGGWNRYTSATWALDQVTGNKFENGRFGLATYANILHSFGQDAFMTASVAGGGQSIDAWYKACSRVTGRDMAYYFETLLGHAVSPEAKETAKGYPMYVPVASVYQTGRIYTVGENEVQFDTMQPFQIEYGKEYTLDLNKYATDGFTSSGSVVLPAGFDYEITKITQPEHGKLEKTAEKTYKYTPDSNMRSGKFIVTIKLTATDDAYKGFTLEDIDLVLELEQTHEINKNMLERTTYTFAEGSVPESAAAAFESNYSGNISAVKTDNLNKTQNCNADIWYTNKDGDDCPANSVVELSGKLHVDEGGKYRIALRGRFDIALYVSFDEGKNYEPVGASKEWTGNSFMNKGAFNEKCPYQDYELEADSWVYFKAVMVTQTNGSTASYIGVGWGKFVPPQGVIDENGEVVGEAPESISVAYATAYRSDYEFANEFESEYFYTRAYSWSYVDETEYSTYDKAGEGENYEVELLSKLPAGNYWSNGDFFDGNDGTYYHSNSGVSEAQPVELIIDMGRTITVNSLTVFSRSSQPGAPKTFTLSVSDDGENYRLIGEYKDYAKGSTSVTAKFDTASFRYFKLNVTETTHGSNFLILREIRFSYSRSLPGGSVLAVDDDAVSCKGKWSTETKLSTYGHVYIGKKGASAQFEFEGKRLGILVPVGGKSNVEVRIDGKKVKTIELTEGTGYATAQYISPELSEGKHKVEIKCKGDTKIDSFVIWN